MVGLPDTLWFPSDALGRLPDHALSFLLFPVKRPELFDAVLTDAHEQVQSIQVKSPSPTSNWVWGAFKMPGHVLQTLHALWVERGRCDEYVGTLINAYLALGGRATGICAGERYIDVGTLHGYRQALRLLDEMQRPNPSEIGAATMVRS